MNPVEMTIINPRKEYWASRGSNQRPSVLNDTDGALGLDVIDLVLKFWQYAVFNHLLPMVQELSPFERRIFVFKLTVSVKMLAGVFYVSVE